MAEVSVYIETHGCQMNEADTARAATRLRAAGYRLTAEPAAADVVLFNTCSVRARAEQKVFHRIREVRRGAGAKEQLVGVLGCVAQLEGATLFDSSARIDLVVGTRATDRLPALIDAARAGAKGVVDLAARGPEDSWAVEHTARRSPHVAFVPIIEGCNKFCTYCIVPYSRGREQSRPAAEIVAEIEDLARHGYKEVQLIGQNVNSYRPKTEAGLADFPGATPFARLLRACAATGLPRIKYTTSFPRDFHTDIVAAMDEHENLCDWIHLPVQSGSDRVLRAMRRGYKAADYLARVAAVKGARRRYALTTDIIVGFPGETRADFAETLGLVERCEFDSIYIFKYSERPGTPAAKLSDDVSEQEKTARFRELEALQMGIQRRVYESYVGRTISVLVEGVSARAARDVTGHTTCHKVVNFAGGRELLGEIVSVRITEAKAHSLYGELVGV
ncbi:MAG TPA: tRNA (N6-isopentenyl adenosine(37)-C2)-methylthiotransferase MiaB [Pyrinomonadaceae bacterium]|jgi:tRNA-2-methylthio-N6-dimethylallyladenosine synthase